MNAKSKQATGNRAKARARARAKSCYISDIYLCRLAVALRRYGLTGRFD